MGWVIVGGIAILVLGGLIVALLMAGGKKDDFDRGSSDRGRFDPGNSHRPAPADKDPGRESGLRTSPLSPQRTEAAGGYVGGRSITDADLGSSISVPAAAEEHGEAGGSG